MPRRQFVADLQQTRSGALPPHIHDLQAGDDDGQFEFVYRAPTLLPVKITAMVSDVSVYPTSHAYYLFCADDAPKQIAQDIQLMSNLDHKTITQLLQAVSRNLSVTQHNTPTAATSSPSNGDDESEDDDGMMDEYDYGYDDEDDEAFLTGVPQPRNQHTVTASIHTLSSAAVGKDIRGSVRSDLRAVKAAGYRVGIFGNILGGGSAYATIAIRIAKLGISGEAMQAWRLVPEEYLTLAIYYPGGYLTHEQLMRQSSTKYPTACNMRVFCSKTTKPYAQDLIDAFQLTKTSDTINTTEPSQDSTVRNTFISKPLIGLLEEHLIPILKFRCSGLDWQGAEAYFNDVQNGKVDARDGHVPAEYFEREEVNHSLRKVVNADHFDVSVLNKLSFPLLAIQFTLRHFVRCVEFCLVCHRKIDSKLEAIKPYVCDRPLCLFQYMAMGFGPSIEHEIQSQPYVVDLLVSFCYNTVAARRLKDLPIGLAMSVPGLPVSTTPHVPYTSHSLPPNYGVKEATRKEDLSGEFNVEYDQERGEVMFTNKPDGGCPVQRGSWIVLKALEAKVTAEGRQEERHCRVTETTFFPTIMVDPPVTLNNNGQFGPAVRNVRKGSTKVKEVSPATTPRYVSMTLIMYDKDFDTLSESAKCDSICRLLDMLPSVKDMQTFLSKSSSAQLTQWVDRVPPAALSLLRWVIASNRACIMQVDGNTVDKEASRRFKQERLCGMHGYMQFRFAMGAPDKEERFRSAVSTARSRLQLKYPTIFAWHGSPLYNWHMIIREGLNFNDTLNGRAYGDGVYHARDVHTSIGYSGGHYPGGGGNTWSNSLLKVNTAVALNELVNAPKEYISSTPYYVVAQLDWIQTRYLLVKCSAEVKLPTDIKPTSAHLQDPTHTPIGFSGPIVIPAAAITSGDLKDTSRQHAKKLKGSHGDPINVSSDIEYESDETDEEDRELFMEEKAVTSIQATNRKSSKASKTAETFVPGELDYKSLPLMPVPTFANSATTKRLLNELNSIRKLLDNTNAEELGWYIDVEKIENVYQWIVELHSFHKLEVRGKRLPLADDMASKKIKSVVIEVRFGPDFPFSPPYVRVVRPHFLSFAQGGGGHIVIGGAMCMELLTNTGWSSICSMEGVLMQVRLAIASEPFARLDRYGHGDYGVAEAAEGFIRACRTHGWVEPPGFRQIAYGASNATP